MALAKQAKILNDKQQNLILTYLNGTRYPLRNKLIYLLSFKAGLRAKEIAEITWLMVCNADGDVGLAINLNNQASKGQYSGRIIPMHKDLRECLLELYKVEKQKDNFSLENHIIKTERSPRTSAQVIVNFFSLLYKDIGFSGCSSHSGRRTFITNAAKNIGFVGGTLNDVRMLAGHSSLTTTQRYIAYDTEAQKKIVELV